MHFRNWSFEPGSFSATSEWCLYILVNCKRFIWNCRKKTSKIVSYLLSVCLNKCIVTDILKLKSLFVDKFGWLETTSPNRIILLVWDGSFRRLSRRLHNVATSNKSSMKNAEKMKINPFWEMQIKLRVWAFIIVIKVN